MQFKKKILIIDDEMDFTMLLEHILRSTGLYEVAVASDGREGLDKLDSEKPDLVMLDYIMPKLRGDEVLKFIRSQSDFKDLPVVIMSGLGVEGFQKQEENNQAPDFNKTPQDLLGEVSSIAFPQNCIQRYNVTAVLPKPFSRNKFLETVRRVFDGK